MTPYRKDNFLPNLTTVMQTSSDKTLIKYKV